MSNQKINLFNAFDKFIEEMRLYLSKGLKTQYGEAWERKYCESLLHTQREQWGIRLQEGINPIQLIDFGNLKSFALNNRSFFENDFGNQKNTLPTVFGQISEARNMLNHYGVFDNDKAEKAYLHMIDIAKKLDWNKLENDIRCLKRDSIKVSPILSTKDKLKKPKTNQRPNKRQVINLILNTTGVNIDSAHVNLSTINATGEYSVEPNLSRKNNNWFLLLINTDIRIIYVFKIPRNDMIYSKLYKRNDKPVYRLMFNIDDKTFTDTRSHESLSHFKIEECKYDNDSLIFSS